MIIVMVDLYNKYAEIPLWNIIHHIDGHFVLDNVVT
jgi:hypothetical protein